MLSLCIPLLTWHGASAEQRVFSTAVPWGGALWLPDLGLMRVPVCCEPGCWWGE